MSLRLGRKSINKKCAKKAFCETLAKHLYDVCFEIQSAQLLGGLAQKRCCQHQVGKQIMRARRDVDSSLFKTISGLMCQIRAARDNFHSRLFEIFHLD